MADNDRFLLDKILEHQQQEREIPLPPSRAFEFFACEQVLKGFDLSPDEIDAGIVDGTGDGGIDAVFTFLDERLLEEDADVVVDPSAADTTRRGALLELHVLQAKQEGGFGETAIQKVSDSLELLLNLSLDEQELREVYSSLVVDRISVFRTTLENLATKYPKIKVAFWYITKGDSSKLEPNVRLQAERLINQLNNMATGVEAESHFIGSSDLLKLDNTNPSYTLQMKFQKNATSGSGHIALVSLKDYVDFLSDDSGVMRKNIFDWNVRDYEGNVEVNRGISASLRNDDETEFWWLNNGVTIIP